MSFALKTLLMKRMISKKQKNRRFDLEKADSFSLKGDEDPSINNSYYFSAHGTDESFYCRLGLRTDRTEVWFYYSKGNMSYVLRNNLYGTEDYPLHVEKTEKGWNISFIGDVVDSEGKERRLEASFKFEPTEEAVDFFHMPAVRMAKAMAFQKWTKEYFAEVQKNDQVHYEQKGELKGRIVVEDKEINLDLPCTRDHSYGTRNWDYMNNHLWMMGVGKDIELNFSMVSYPTMTIFEVGNYKGKDKEMAFLLSADYDREKIAKGTIPPSLSLVLKLTDGTKLPVKAEVIYGEEYFFQDGCYHFVEGIAQYTIGEEVCRGIFEIGFNKDEKRWFNGKKTGELKK